MVSDVCRYHGYHISEHNAGHIFCHILNYVIEAYHNNTFYISWSESIGLNLYSLHVYILLGLNHFEAFVWKDW